MHDGCHVAGLSYGSHRPHRLRLEFRLESRLESRPESRPESRLKEWIRANQWIMATSTSNRRLVSTSNRRPFP